MTLIKMLMVTHPQTVVNYCGTLSCGKDLLMITGITDLFFQVAFLLSQSYLGTADMNLNIFQ